MNIIDRYRIRIDKNDINFNLPNYISIPRGCKITETDTAFEFKTETAWVTIWKKSTHTHIAIYE